MKIILLADLHGNLPATLAMEEELNRVGPDDVWFLGDAVGKGWKRAVFNIILGLALIFACIGSGKSIKSNVIDKLAPPKAPAAETVPAPAVPETPALDAPAEEAAAESEN